MAKAQPPTEVRVAGKVYTITPEAKGALGSDRVGEAKHSSLEIIYDSEWALAQQKDTVLHEVIHCCEQAAGAELDERDVASIATLLYGVAQDNPDLWRWLAE